MGTLEIMKTTIIYLTICFALYNGALLRDETDYNQNCDESNCYVRLRRAHPWLGTAQICHDLGGSMVEPSLDNMDKIYELTYNGLFWTGVNTFNPQQQLVHFNQSPEGSAIAGIENKCIATKYTTLVAEPCSHKYQSVCVLPRRDDMSQLETGISYESCWNRCGGYHGFINKLDTTIDCVVSLPNRCFSPQFTRKEIFSPLAEFSDDAKVYAATRSGY